MRAAIYLRVSTKDRGQDTENQRIQLERLCRSSGYEIVKTYEDNESGGKGRAERKAFGQMFEDAEKKKFDIVVFWALDRFSRQGITMTLHYLQLLETHGVGFRSLQEPFLNTDNELVRHILLTVISYFAELERKRISERTKAGLEKAVRRGKKLGAPKKSRYKKQLLEMKEEGLSQREMARRTGLSINTVRKYIML